MTPSPSKKPIHDTITKLNEEFRRVEQLEQLTSIHVPGRRTRIPGTTLVDECKHELMVRHVLPYAKDAYQSLNVPIALSREITDVIFERAYRLGDYFTAYDLNTIGIPTPPQYNFDAIRYEPGFYICKGSLITDNGPFVHPDVRMIPVTEDRTRRFSCVEIIVTEERYRHNSTRKRARTETYLEYLTDWMNFAIEDYPELPVRFDAPPPGVGHCISSHNCYIDGPLPERTIKAVQTLVATGAK